MNFFEIMKKILIFFILGTVLYPASILAAGLQLESGSNEVRTGDIFKVDVVVNSDNESVNAIEGEVRFPIDTLELKEIKIGSSILTFWIESPHEINPGRIFYSGITPGGFNLPKALVFSIFFQAKRDGLVNINLANSKVLKNDGLGTEAGLTLTNINIYVRSDIPSQMVVYDDNIPPEKFKVQVIQDPNVFEGKYFLVFTAQDKDSGIDRYEVKEGKNNYKITQSPYLLENQELTSDITVKAVDKHGNERLSKVPAPKAPWYKKYGIIGILIISVLVLALLRKILPKKLK